MKLLSHPESKAEREDLLSTLLDFSTFIIHGLDLGMVAPTFIAIKTIKTILPNMPMG